MADWFVDGAVFALYWYVRSSNCNFELVLKNNWAKNYQFDSVEAWDRDARNVNLVTRHKIMVCVKIVNYLSGKALYVNNLKLSNTKQRSTKPWKDSGISTNVCDGKLRWRYDACNRKNSVKRPIGSPLNLHNHPC